MNDFHGPTFGSLFGPLFGDKDYSSEESEGTTINGFFGPFNGPLFGPLFGYIQTEEGAGELDTITKYVDYSNFTFLKLAGKSELPIKRIGESFYIKLIDRNERDWSSINIAAYYWDPSNKTNTPTGTISSSNISKSDNELTIKIDGSILDEESQKYSNFRIQVIDTDSGAAWEPPTEIKILNRGAMG